MTRDPDSSVVRAGGLMEPHLIDDLAYKETFYWWHRVRRHNLYRLLVAATDLPSRVLEIGCGTGENLRGGSRLWGSAVGIDLDLQALVYCRGLVTVQADATAPLPFADSSFDAAFLLDVVEHLADPRSLVGEIGRLLEPGGAVVVMVPAGPGLWSYWDEMHGHRRRYTRQDLAALFGDGWRLECLEYSFSWMYPVVWGFRRVMQRRRRSAVHSDFIELPRVLNAAQIVLGRIESRIQRYLRIPFGTTLCGLWSRAGAA